jgi:hypothetical protein
VKRNVIILRPGEDPADFVREFVSVPKKLKRISIKSIKEMLEEEYAIH